MMAMISSVAGEPLLHLHVLKWHVSHNFEQTNSNATYPELQHNWAYWPTACPTPDDALPVALTEKYEF